METISLDSGVKIETRAYDFFTLNWIMFLSNLYLSQKSLRLSVDLSLPRSVTKSYASPPCTLSSSHTGILSWLNVPDFLPSPVLRLWAPSPPIPLLEWCFLPFMPQLEFFSEIPILISQTELNPLLQAYTEKYLIHFIYRSFSEIILFTYLWIYCLLSLLLGKSIKPKCD